MKYSVRLATLISLLALMVSAPSFASAIKVHGPAPDFTLPAPGGKHVKLSDFKGQVVMLNFWASWCGPCREEMPLIEGLYNKYNGLGFTVLGVNVDTNSNDGMAMMKQLKVTFPVGFDAKNKVSELYKIDAMPSTVMIDAHGNMRFLHRGYKPGTEVEYDQEIRELIREN